MWPWHANMATWQVVTVADVDDLGIVYFPNKAWILFLHRKLYVLNWWSALFLLPLHITKEFPRNGRRGFYILSRAKPDITFSFNLISKIQVISDKKHIIIIPSIFRELKHLSGPLWLMIWYDDWFASGLMITILERY